MVDDKRIEELTEKRQDTGLSDEEADELGRLFAEQEGKPYSNAKLSKLPPGERGADVLVPDSLPEAYASSEELSELSARAQEAEVIEQAGGAGTIGTTEEEE